MARYVAPATGHPNPPHNPVPQSAHLTAQANPTHFDSTHRLEKSLKKPSPKKSACVAPQSFSVEAILKTKSAHAPLGPPVRCVALSNIAQSVPAQS